MLNIESLIKKPYYYVPPCPRCESRMTGRFVQAHKAADTEWVINESLKNGELVEAVPEVGKFNCFCAKCGYKWDDIVSLKFMSLEEIKEEKWVRFTNDILKCRMDEEREILMEKRKKHSKAYNVVTETVKGFLGIKK